jgi:DNA-directed RNA polymerase subunit RPC12/RpoP
MTQKLALYECSVCSAKFERISGREYLFCSRACYHRSRIGRKRLPRQLLSHNCEWCGAEFKSLSSAGARKKFCSRSCQAYSVAKPSVCKTMTTAQLAYLAGIIDGEGSIQIFDRTATRPGASRPSIRVSVANTHMPLLVWIQESCGLGVICVQNGGNPKIKTNKTCYSWGITSIAAVRFLVQVEPYLIEKRNLALSAIRSQPKALARVC